jgi:hypothetical protein
MVKCERLSSLPCLEIAGTPTTFSCAVFLVCRKGYPRKEDLTQLQVSMYLFISAKICPAILYNILAISLSKHKDR